MALLRRKKVGRQAKTDSGRMAVNYYRSAAVTPKKSPFQPKSKRPRVSRSRVYFIRTIDIALVAVLLGLLVYSLLVRPEPTVTINDMSYRPKGVYQIAAAKELSSLGNRNKLTLNEDAIVSSLKKQFPEIASASIELPLFSEKPVVHIKIAPPSFFLSSNNVNYIIDSQGVATTEASNLPSIKQMAILNDQSGFGARLGQQVLSAQNVAFINTLLAQLGRANIPVKSLTLPTQVQEIDLSTTDRNYYTKFYLGGDPLLQSGQFLASRHHFDQTGPQPSEYLDVRVPGKIYFK